MIAILKAAQYYSILTFFVVVLTACSTTKSSQHIDSTAPQDDIVLIQSSGFIESNLDDTPIEKVILTLPVRPGMRNFFEEMVAHARENYPTENHGDADKLFIGGDGSRGVITFRLNRDDRSLRVSEVDETRISAVKNEYYLYRIPDGWVQSKRRLPLEARLHSHNRVAKYWEGVGG